MSDPLLRMASKIELLETENEELRAAIRRIVSKWEIGDLAAAVRDADALVIRKPDEGVGMT